MTTSAPAPTTIEEIVDGLKDHVWVLLRAGHVYAAMALLADSVEDYLRIVAEVDVDAGRHSAPDPDEEPEAAPAEPEPDPADEDPVAVEVVEVRDLPSPASPALPAAVLVTVEEGATWEIPLQSSKGKAVMLRERS